MTATDADGPKPDDPEAKRAQALAAAAKRERRTLRRWAISAWTASAVYAAWVWGPLGLIDWRLAAQVAIGGFLAGPLLADLGWATLKWAAERYVATQKFKYKIIRRLRIYRAVAFIAVAIAAYYLSKTAMLLMFAHLPQNPTF
ncbi:MAG: hypothetical protein AAF684_05045 [Pseudomonadota bacterium]